MEDCSRYVMPRRLDDPERWLFWTFDEAGVLLGSALLGLAANAFFAGLAFGTVAWLALRRVKRGGARAAHSALYWFLPDFALRLSGTPPSHVRLYMG